jgi:hypothetical protein
MAISKFKYPINAVKALTATALLSAALATATPAMAEDININDNTNVTVRSAPPDFCAGKGPAYEACEHYVATIALQRMHDVLEGGPLKMARGPAPEPPRCAPDQWLTIDGCQGSAPQPPVQRTAVVHHAAHQR